MGVWLVRGVVEGVVGFGRLLGLSVLGDDISTGLTFEAYVFVLYIIISYTQ